MIVHHDLGRAPCVRPVIVWAEALFAEQRDIIAGVLLSPQRGPTWAIAKPGTRCRIRADSGPTGSWRQPEAGTCLGCHARISLASARLSDQGVVLLANSGTSREFNNHQPAPGEGCPRPPVTPPR